MQAINKKVIIAVLVAMITLPTFYIGYVRANSNVALISSTKSAECISLTAGSAQPYKLPLGWKIETIIEEDIAQAYIEDLPDMNQQNMIEIDMPQALKDHGVDDDIAERGRLLYQTHERWEGGSSVSVVDLETRIAAKMLEADHLEALDGLLWTPWNTLIFAEEMDVQNLRDPNVPDAIGGLAYEMDPVSGDYWPLPQLGAMAHEGIVIDKSMNIYVVDEDKRGSIYKFIPNENPMINRRIGDGDLYVLRIIDDTAALGERTGTAEWILLNQTLVRIDAEKAAEAVNATLYNRPEDLELIGNKLYVALTGASSPGPVDNRIISIDISNPTQPFVTEFVVPGINVPIEIDDDDDKSDEQTGFSNPDNLAKRGNELWIAEDNSPSDIWVAKPDKDGDGYSDKVTLFTSMEDCVAESTGILWGIGKYHNKLFITQQHAGPIYEDVEIGVDKIFVISRG